MHRINYDPTTRNKHEDLQFILSQALSVLKTTLDAGETPNGVILDGVIACIELYRPELEHCNGLEIKYIPGLMPDFYPLHADLIGWLNELSITLKLRLAGVEDPVRPIVNVARIEAGQRMINALSCRERLVWR